MGVNNINRLPKVYIDNIQNIIENAKLIFKKELINIILGGSCGKFDCIIGWSDIDIYITLEEYVLPLVKKFDKIISESNIHIGVTYYSKIEVLNNFIDSKTKVMVYEKYYLNFNPTLYGENLFIKNNYDVIINNDINNLPNFIHLFRRIYIEKTNENAEIDKKYIKKLILLIKCFLNTKKIFSYGYQKSIDLFLNEYNKNINSTNKFNFDIITMMEDLNKNKLEILNFSEIILAFIIKEIKEEK